MYIYIIAMLLPTNPHLVGGFNPSEKYESQMGLLFPTECKNEKTFSTTNQVNRL
jgi:hypothetical protein